ncbi:MAG: beta-ketoacyl synthase N-terminal-like domain-containing protein [Algisphaera sp.]
MGSVPHPHPPIVITGAGLVTPLGVGREATWAAVCTNRVGLGPYTAIEDPAQADRGGGEIPRDARIDPAQPREAAHLRFALNEALEHAGLNPTGQNWPIQPHRAGLMLGTTLHGMTAAGQMVRQNSAQPLREFLAPAVIARAASHLPCHGFSATTCSACSSGLGSMLLAMTLLQSGELDLVIAGGYDPISEYAYAGFNSLRLVDERPPRPFARDRAGMKVSEGYAVVILERAASAAARNAAPLAWLAGGGESADAHHLTQPKPDGAGAAHAMQAALNQSGLSANQINLVVAHATGTPDNDAAEVSALQSTFGPALASIPTVGLKSRLGHTLGAAGATELVLATLALRDDMRPTTAQTTTADHDFKNFCLSEGDAAPAPLNAALSTSLGFGGANTSVVTRTPPAHGFAPCTTKPNEPNDVFITGIGLITPDAIGREAFATHLASGQPATCGPIAQDLVLAQLLNARRARRLSNYVKNTLAAARLALDDAGVAHDDWAAFGQNTAGLLGTTHGSTQYSYAYYRGIVDDGLQTANPMQFAEGVPNAGAAHLSMTLKLTGACQTFIGSRTSGLDALRLAALRIAQGEWQRAIVCAGEEHDPLVERCLAELGLPMTTAGGAVTLVLESAHAAGERGATPLARIMGGTQVNASGNASRHTSLLTDLITNNTAGNTWLCPLGGATNPTWLSRLEAIALRRAQLANTPTTNVFPAGIAECFSATPLLTVAAAINALKPGDSHSVLAGDAHGLHTMIQLCSP